MKIQLAIACFILSSGLPLQCVRAANDTFLDPGEGEDYKFQGEYAGDKIGAQVIALGENKFRAVFYHGGLPGAGWDGEAKHESGGGIEGDKVVFGMKGKQYSGTISGGKLAGETEIGGKFELKKIERKSPTLGEKAPAGATVLFDGTNADAWEGGHIDSQKRLMAGVKTKQHFQNFSLHVEFYLPFKPSARGQERGNSGVYLQDRYEVQVLDSFGLKGENNECGGIYSQVAPKLNMCFPPLTWQTYDIDFQSAQFEGGKKTGNAVVTVKQNGVVIHDKQEIQAKTGGGQEESPEPGPIQLQGHGNPVFYKNVWVVEKK